MSNKTCFPWSVVKSVALGMKRFPSFTKGMGQTRLSPRSMILKVESLVQGSSGSRRKKKIPNKQTKKTSKTNGNSGSKKTGHGKKIKQENITLEGG